MTDILASDVRGAAHRALVEAVLMKLSEESDTTSLGFEEEQGAKTTPESSSEIAVPSARFSSSYSDKPHRLEALNAHWEEMFSKLVEYKKKHGSCLVPNRYAGDRQLGSWVSTQRRKYKEKNLPKHREERLCSLGFAWATQDPRCVPWTTRYQQLREFYARYGHSKVPMNYHDKSLANWVSAQRQDRKNDSLSQERIDLLNRVEFVWDGLRSGRYLCQNEERPRDVTTVSLSSTEGEPEAQREPTVASSGLPGYISETNSTAPKIPSTISFGGKPLPQSAMRLAAPQGLSFPATIGLLPRPIVGTAVQPALCYAIVSPLTLPMSTIPLHPSIGATPLFRMY
jgi:hypothetical protein